MGKWIALGCGCLLIIAIAVAGGIYYFIDKMSPGEEVAAADVTLGQQYQTTYTQEGDTQYEIWLDLDVTYSQGLQLTGPINITVNDEHVGQYQLSYNGSGAPIQGRSGSKRVNWTSTNINGNGSASGKLFLFKLPAYDEGANVMIWGTINGSPGMAAQRLRLMVTD